MRSGGTGKSSQHRSTGAERLRADGAPLSLCSTRAPQFPRVTMSAGESEADHPRFFVGADEGEGDELLDPGRVLGYDCLYENVEEEEEEDDEEYDSVSDKENENTVYL